MRVCHSLKLDVLEDQVLQHSQQPAVPLSQAMLRHSPRGPGPWWIPPHTLSQSAGEKIRNIAFLWPLRLRCRLNTKHRLEPCSGAEVMGVPVESKGPHPFPRKYDKAGLGNLVVSLLGDLRWGFEAATELYALASHDFGECMCPQECGCRHGQAGRAFTLLQS